MTVSVTVQATLRPATQTFATQAADLHTLLQSAGEPGPYVIVGHSFGGAEAVTFASMFPTEVRGLLLVDASPPAWNTAICAVPDDGSDAAGVFQALCVRAVEVRPTTSNTLTLRPPSLKSPRSTR